jgi:hypothetical protein
MPEEDTIRRAHEDAKEGKAQSTQAGEFVREEIHHVREGKHGARSTKQAIAIGLSKARRGSGSACAFSSSHLSGQSPQGQARLSTRKASAQDLQERSRAVEGALPKRRPCVRIAACAFSSCALQRSQPHQKGTKRGRKERRENARFTLSTESGWTRRRAETQAVGEKGKHRIHLSARRGI